MRARWLWLAAVVAFAVPARAQEPAGRADDFVDRMGFATHWGYPDTPYGFAYDKVKALLAASGVRHVRDGFHPRLKELYAQHGIRATVIADPGDVNATRRLVDEYRPCLAMVEGPNEVALFPRSAAYQGKGFPEGPRLWMRDLYAALKGNPATRPLPVIAPSTGNADGNYRLAPMADFDLCVMHSYAGGQMPSSSLHSDINNNVALAYAILGRGARLKPLAVTESGYHTALGSSVVLGGAQPGVSERAQARYLPRHFAEYYNAGIVRTFTYEFMDEFPDYGKDEREATNAEACFGIVKRDLTPKPAYHALRNLVSLLSEARWDRAAQRWKLPSPGFRPRALAFELTGDTRNIHHTLLQKADGSFWLLLWQEVPSFDLRTRQDIANPDAAVTLRLASPAVSVTVYRPGTGASPIRTVTGSAGRPVRSVALGVPDEVLAVRIAPAPAGRAAAPQSPRALRAATTADSAAITWQPPAGPRPAGYFMWRMGAYVGRAASTTFRDERLVPGAGYTYTVAAYSADGSISAPAAVLAQTRDELPDLVVTAIGWQGALRSGEPIRFTATVANRGPAPTPAGVVVGVSFAVDGAQVAWCDTLRGPLKPGDTRTVAANNGPRGTPAWTPAPGRHVVRAVVDDVNRIVESDHGNNALEKTIDVP